MVRMNFKQWTWNSFKIGLSIKIQTVHKTWLPGRKNLDHPKIRNPTYILKWSLKRPTLRLLALFGVFRPPCSKQVTKAPVTTPGLQTTAILSIPGEASIPVKLQMIGLLSLRQIVQSNVIAEVDQYIPVTWYVHFWKQMSVPRRCSMLTLLRTTKLRPLHLFCKNQRAKQGYCCELENLLICILSQFI